MPATFSKNKVFFVVASSALLAFLAALYDYDRALDAKLSFYEDLSELKDESKYVPGWIDSIPSEYSVMLASKTKPEEFDVTISELVGRYGGEVKSKLKALNTFYVTGLSPKAAAKMSQDEKVLFVVANRVLPLDGTSQPPPYLRPID
jgi:hypothetical protein